MYISTNIYAAHAVMRCSLRKPLMYAAILYVVYGAARETLRIIHQR